jgi:uncharacterized protein with FMN-binding domain
MKRALLIAGGTVGGLGAVLAITPPNLSKTTIIAAGNPAPAPSATPTKSSAPTSNPSVAPTVAPTKPVAAAGSFTGSVANTRYGPVQVKITVENGKIVDAQAVKAPSGSNDRYTQMAVPRLREQTIAAQSANIQGVSGASFTSFGWYTSLVSAIAKAGL